MGEATTARNGRRCECHSVRVYLPICLLCHQDSEGPEGPKDKKRKSKKDKKHKKHKKEKSSKCRLEALRKERLEREKHENFREQEISSLSKPRAPVKEHKYNTGYHRNLTR